VALPDFSAERPEGAADFNDLHRAEGLDAVRRVVGAAVASIAG
jgi:putative DNA primase/helicase